MIKTDTGIITIAVEHYPGWFTADFPGHFQRFDGQSAVRRERHCPTYRFPCKQVENNGKVCPTFPRPDVRHVAAPYLIWLCHCELPPKVIRDSDMFTTTSFRVEFYSNTPIIEALQGSTKAPDLDSRRTIA